LNGKGRWHQGRYDYQSYLAVRGGWKCGISTGYAGCSQGSMYVQAGPIRASAARFDYVDCGSNGGGLEFDIHSVSVSCHTARRVASRWFSSADGTVPGWRCRAGQPHNFGHATCTAAGGKKVGFHYLVGE
jgi:hypothetical protein